MTTLDNILPAVNNASFDGGETTALPGAQDENCEPFHQVMARMQSPPEANPPSPHNRRQPTNSAAAQKKISTGTNLPGASATKIPPTIAKDSSEPVIKAGVQPGNQAEKNKDLSAQDMAGAVSDVSQNTSILLLAPTLAACLLNSFAPATVPKFATNNPAVVAALPAGVDAEIGAPTLAAVPAVDAKAKQTVAESVLQLEAGVPQKTAAAKNSEASKLPAEKPKVKTNGEAVVVPNNSELAGAEAAAPKKVEAVTAKDFQHEDPDNSANSQSQTAESDIFAPVKPHGTGVAKQDMPMKNTEQTNKIAGSDGKIFPDEAIFSAREKNLPGRASPIPVSARVELPEASVATVSALPESSVRGTVSADESVAVSTFSDLRSQTLDRTHDLLALHATRLVGANSDSLQVVIKPDAGTQLSLELRQRGSGIEAQAVLQKGDLENLKQHWPELQQRLEQRGIKLAPLTSDGNSMTWSGNQNFRNQPEQPAEREALPAGMITGFAPVGAMTISPAEPVIPATSSSGWQTWA
jgi:hypothetical protein